MLRIRTIALCCALLFILVAVGAFSGSAAQTDTVYIRKHVSMVYDNSGSMSQDLGGTSNLKWCYASYAAQAFAGLLNDTDSLTITFMQETVAGKTLELDMAGDRQKQLDNVLHASTQASGNTPIQSVYDAMDVLIRQGLLSDAQLNGNQAQEGEQFWLVLTTDGNFDDIAQEEFENTLAGYLEDYSNLQLVYFAIGTEGDTSDQSAKDLRTCTKLTAYPNFTAVFAQKQNEIISTMQTLSNRISGRYDVADAQFSGNTVSFRISGETSPIRNIALLAQNTDAKLVDVKSSDGAALTLARSANVSYPHNEYYDNMPSGTKGGHIALITCEAGKLPPSVVTLTFSEPVSKDSFSLMYEPAIYLSLNVQRQDSSGNWVDVPQGQKLYAGESLRVNYSICEDGTDTPIDPKKLPGASTATISCADEPIKPNDVFQLPAGNTQLSASVSLMDGAYRISTVRTLYASDMGDFSVKVSDPLTFYTEDLQANTAQYIDFTVLYGGKPADADILTDFRLDTGNLQGQVTSSGAGVFRFTPQQTDCPAGDYTVTLYCLDREMAAQTVTVKEDIATFSATAEGSLSLFTNELASNTKAIVFNALSHRERGDAPVTAEESTRFRVEAVSANGTVLNGAVSFREPGQFHFVTTDAQAAPSDYTVTIYCDDDPLATATVSVIQYNATFTAKVFRIGEDTVDRLHLWDNENGLAFVVYADGEPCSAPQLSSMLGSTIVLRNDPKSLLRLDTSVGTFDGKPALLVRPTTGAATRFGAALQRLVIVWGAVPLGELTVTMEVNAPKGTSVSGQMQVVNSNWEMWLWRLIFCLILTVTVLILWVLFCNKNIPRIYPGYLLYYQLKQTDAYYHVISNDTLEIKNKFYFRLTLTPEAFAFRTMHFQADATARNRKLFHLNRTFPECTVKGSEHPLGNIYYKSRTMDSEQLLKTLSDKPFGRISCSDVNKKIPRNPVTTLGSNQFSTSLAEGEFLMKKTTENDAVVLEFWAFERMDESTDNI